MLLLVPASRMSTRFRQRALKVTAGVTAAGYALLLGLLAYVKLKTCDVNAVPHDRQWHCNVEGKSILVYFLLTPLLAAIVSLAVGGVCWFVRKRKNSVN